MPVIRVEKTKNYTVMSNYHLRDKTLSLKAKGLLSTMLSLPDEWDYSIAGLAALSIDGDTAVRTGLKELESKHYLKRSSIRDKGKIVDWEYTVYESPRVDNPQLEKPDVEKPDVEKPDVENPQLDKPQLENRPQLNTKELSTKELSTKESSTKESSTKESSTKESSTKESSTKELKENIKRNATACQSDDIKTEFNNLWSLYPKKQGKERAINAYKKARKGCPELFAIVEKGIKSYTDYIAATQTDMQYVKQGGTWFYQHCWEDDYTIRGNSNGQFAKYDGQDSGQKSDSYENYVMGIDL